MITNTIYLLSVDYIKKNSVIPTELDDQYLDGAILETQNVDLQDIIKETLYNKILLLASGSTISGDYKTLIEDNVGDDLSLDYFYVKTSNTQLARQYFETNYDPEGRMLTLDWFGGNLNAYNDHVTSFRAATYPQDVSSKKDIQDLTIFENRNELDQDIQSLPNRISQNFNLYLISGLIGFQIISFLMLFFYKIIVNKSRLFLMTSLIGSFIFLSLFSLFNYLSYTSQFVFNPLQSSLILQLNPLLWILLPFLWGNVTLLVLSGIWYFILNSKKFQKQYRRF
jgi:hypothetical protein